MARDQANIELGKTGLWANKIVAFKSNNIFSYINSYEYYFEKMIISIKKYLILIQIYYNLIYLNRIINIYIYIYIITYQNLTKYDLFFKD